MIKEDNENIENTKEISTQKKSLGIFEIWKYADFYDIISLIFGIIFAIINGICYTFALLLLHGTLDDMNSIGIKSIDEAKDDVSNSAFNAFLIAVLSCISAFLYIVFFRISAGILLFILLLERQVSRIRNLYFKALLYHDIEWYDNNDPKVLSSRAINDTNLIINGIGMDLGKAIRIISQIISSFIIGFSKVY